MGLEPTFHVRALPADAVIFLGISCHVIARK